MNRTKSMERLTSQLNKKKIPTFVQNSFFEFGPAAFDYLSNSIVNGTLSSRQKINALHILYFLSREKCHEKKSDVFDIANKLLMEQSVEIRSEAAIISVYLAQIFEKFTNLNPHYNRLGFIQKINNTLKNGVLDRSKPLLEKYLSNYYSEQPSSLSRLNTNFKKDNESVAIRNQIPGMNIIPYPAVIESIYYKPMDIDLKERDNV